MGKHVKAALLVAIAVFIPAAIAAGFSSTMTVFAAGGTFLSSAVGMAALSFGTTLVSSLIGGMTSKGLNASGANFGSKFAARAPTAPRQLIYGKCRVGGTIVHMETTGTDNFLLHAVVVLSGHEIESLESVRLNDVDLTTSSSTISGSTVFTVTNSEFSNTENENKYDSNGRLVRFCFEDGSQTAANGYAVAQSSLVSTDKFLDCAFVYIVASLAASVKTPLPETLIDCTPASANKVLLLELSLLVTSTDSLLTVRLVDLKPAIVVKVSGEPALPTFISIALPFCAAIFILQLRKH